MEEIHRAKYRAKGMPGLQHLNVFTNTEALRPHLLGVLMDLYCKSIIQYIIAHW